MSSLVSHAWIRGTHLATPFFPQSFQTDGTAKNVLAAEERMDVGAGLGRANDDRAGKESRPVWMKEADQKFGDLCCATRVGVLY